MAYIASTLHSSIYCMRHSRALGIPSIYAKFKSLHFQWVLSLSFQDTFYTVLTSYFFNEDATTRVYLHIKWTWSDMAFWRLAAYFASMRISLNPMAFRQSSIHNFEPSASDSMQKWFGILFDFNYESLCVGKYLLWSTSIFQPLYVVPCVDQFHT